jgi:hypothetical protein
MARLVALAVGVVPAIGPQAAQAHADGGDTA